MTITAPSRSPDAMPSVREGVIRLGMPHLALAGLSETWLLKELGDRHWRLIAEAAGLDDPDFRDVDGAPVYPAFCGTSIEAARFDVLREHDALVLSSDLSRVSATQWASRHTLACCGVPVGTVNLSSIFVRRKALGQNRALARIAPELLARVPIRRDFASITAVASTIRSGAWRSHFGFTQADARPEGREVFRPCPAQDFNGAGFLYFPSFSALVDRAEWTLFGLAAATTIARDVVYHANIDVGEAVMVEVCASRTVDEEFAHWCRLASGDGRRLADVFTCKRIIAVA